MANEEFVEKLIKERYCVNDDEKQGDIWDNICGRVANYLGKTDDEVNVFHDMMYRKDFLPNSPTLMNAGTETSMLSACFKAGTMIETITIPTPIERVNIGDMVLSDDGTYNRVTNTMMRNDFVYKLKIDKLPPMYVTGEHPVLTNNGWKCVKNLTPKNDFAKIGSPNILHNDHTITFDGIEIDGYIYVPITNKESLRAKKRNYNIQTNIIKNNIKVDEELSWFIGMYLAEGSISEGYDLRFVLNTNEKDYALRIASILKNKFGLKSTIKETLHPTTWLTVRTHSKFLTQWIDKNFGHGFNKKYIPHWVYHLNHSCLTSFIQGIDDGDGCYSNEKSRTIILSNEPLIRQIFTLLKILGYSPTLKIWKMPKLGTVLPCDIRYGQHNIGMVRDSEYYRVSSVELTTEKCNVYNLEVENTHTYIANQVIVHNCFFLPISDCISNGKDGIFDQVKNAALIFKYGGGVGLNFSNLRPHGSKVKSTNGVSSGVISFMRNFNIMTETIKQGGKRRGALMGCLDITHPEIKNFITCKTTEGDLSNFNISVKLTDKFMKNVKNDSPEELEIFNMIVDGIYKNGEPGLLFSDEIERHNPTPELGELNVNPCVTGDTLIYTKRYGEAPISDFVDEEIEIWNGYEWSMVTPKITGCDQPILNVNIKSYDDAEYNIKCTPDHTFILREPGTDKEIRKPASELISGDIIYPFKPFTTSNIEFSDYVIYSISEYHIPSHKVYCLNEPKNHSFLANGVLIGNCSEALLRSFESCNLGSIAWSHLYKNSGKQWEDNIDWVKYDTIIRNSVIFLNRVIDGNQYPLPEIDEATRFTRKIGLGGMGFHDLLLKLVIPYESEEALTVAKAIEIYLKTIAKNESDKHNFKNTSLTTIAPTGTISIIADVSSGIEPVFNWVITRKDSIGEHYIVHPIFEQELRKIPMPEQFKNITPTPDIYNEVIRHCHEKGTIQDIDWLPKSFKRLFKNAMDIHWKHHIKMQAVFQTNGVDMAISKTINLPNNATKNDIGEAIFMAWEMHCKGITIYRSGSREVEVLNLKKDKPTSHEVKPEIIHKEPEIIQELRTRLDDQIAETRQQAILLAVDEAAARASYKRPRLLYGGTYKVQSGCGKLYVTINERNGKPYEVFIQSGGSGGCEAGNQALGRTISLALRNGGDIRNIIKQLYKVKCPAALKNPRSEGKSCSDIVGKLITESIPDEDEEEVHAPHQTKLFEECPDCHEKTLVRESGCKVCHACGYNKCG